MSSRFARAARRHRSHPSRDARAEQEAIAHAWQWFALHAGQRMQLVNSFLVGVALVVAGYGVALNSRSYLLALGIGLVGVILSFAFWMLEERTKQLIKAAEIPIAEFQSRLSARSGVESLKLVESVENPKAPAISYARALRVLMFSVLVWMVLASAVALVLLVAAGQPVGFPAPAPAASPSP